MTHIYKVLITSVSESVSDILQIRPKNRTQVQEKIIGLCHKVSEQQDFRIIYFFAEKAHKIQIKSSLQ